MSGRVESWACRPFWEEQGPLDCWLTLPDKVSVESVTWSSVALLTGTSRQEASDQDTSIPFSPELLFFASTPVDSLVADVSSMFFFSSWGAALAFSPWADQRKIPPDKNIWESFSQLRCQVHLLLPVPMDLFPQHFCRHPLPHFY